MSRNRLFTLLAALALFPAAAHAQGTTTITACYVPKSGTVYRIKVEGSPGKCAQNHVEFSWETGGTGWGGYSTYSESFTIQPGDWDFNGVSCPAGTAPMSGGFAVHQPETANVTITSSQLIVIGFAWSVGVRNDGSEPAEVTVHAYCAAYPT